ncbi:hypothetical protein [Nocardia sp. NBC_01327]|nr:ankyrin repeat domain-containing protein [Nocardia sp. NBC_01327]
MDSDVDLIAAVRAGDLKHAEVLLGTGADSNATDADGNTVLVNRGVE